jgi:hypothetical protein
MALKERLRQDVASAMRSGDAERRDALRLLLAAIKQVEVDSRTNLDDAGVLAVLNKQAKQRRESIADYERAGRPEAAARESAELDIILSYLPQTLSREAVAEMAGKAIAETGASDMKDMGRVMGRLMPELKGKADGQLVSDVVRELLGHGR